MPRSQSFHTEVTNRADRASIEKMQRATGVVLL